MSIGKEPRLVIVSSVSEKTEPKSFEIINEKVLLDLLKDLKTGPIYWQSADHVTFGLYTGEINGSLLFAEDYQPAWEHLQELRVFNSESELRIWRDGKTYRGRVITDDKDAPEDKNGNCLEQEVKLWGTLAEKSKSSDRFIILNEDRGMKPALPVRWEDRFEKGINAFLKERLYLKENDETGCVYINDRRFCGLYVADEKGELKEVTL